MRRVMLTFALTLWAASHAEASILFTPDDFTLDIRAVFTDTNTDTFCWACGDAIPSNDLRAVLNFPGLSEGWADLFVAHSGLVGFEGTATNYLGLDANFNLHVKLTAAGRSLPESLVNPSVSFGIIRGKLLGVDDGQALVLELSDERVGGIRFLQGFFPTPFVLPPGGGQKLLGYELHLSEQIEYTPAVPEPTSLLLLGSALAAVALKRYRATNHHSR
jgi:PEP-CTERM motif